MRAPAPPAAARAPPRHVAKNLCPCKGCAEVDNLKPKFVAHIGEVATQTIRQQRKLVGIDVILVHRLLNGDATFRAKYVSGEATTNWVASHLTGT